MAPKKNVDKTQRFQKKVREKKVVKPKVKKEKPKLKIPTVVKVKIGASRSTQHNVKNMPVNSVIDDNKTTSKHTTRRLTATMKLDLANEVAREQLVKRSPVSQCEVTPASGPIAKKTETVKKRGCNKKGAAETTDNVTTSSMSDSEVGREQLVKRSPVSQCVVTPASGPTVKKMETVKKRGCNKKGAAETTDNVTTSSISDSEVAREQSVKRSPVSQCKVTPASVPTVKKTETVKKRGCNKKGAAETTDNVTTSSMTDSEVAREQLVKRSPVSQCKVTPASVSTVKKTETVKTRGRNKKEAAETTDNVTASSMTDSEEAFDVTPKKRKYVRKTPIVPTVEAKKKPVITKKNKAVAGKMSSPLSSKKNMRQTKIIDPNTKIVRTIKNEFAVTPVQNDTANAEPKTRRRILIARKGKPDAENASNSDVQISPSLLDQVESVPKGNFLPIDSPTKAKACSIDSRKTSMTGTSESLSWTKDISNSSTTTCVTVCSNDFVRIDKKIPVLKLTQTRHISQLTEPTVVENDASSSDSESSSSEITPRTPRRESSPEIDSHSLNLSTSSVTPNKSRDSNADSDANNEVSVITTDLDKLTAKLKNFDIEIINWIGYDKDDVDVNAKKFQDRIFRVLKEESEVVAHCQRLKKVLSDNVEEENEHDNANVENFDVSVNACRNNMFNEENRSVSNVNSCINNIANSPAKDTSEKSKDREDQYPTQYKYNMSLDHDHSCDDDDALSLFAESLTGIEASRLNSSATTVTNIGASNFEEYIPQPVTTKRQEPASRISYVPSKITNIEVQQSDLKKSVCEKQSADSTSISKETEKNLIDVNFENVCNTAAANNAANGPGQLGTCVTVDKKKVHCLMGALYTAVFGCKSMVFRGKCFFYHIYSCKNPVCRFPHVILEPKEVMSRLARLSEEAFIGEYMLLRNYPLLRRSYGMCFVEECKRRDLTRILVEMAIDFNIKANDNCREDATLRVVVTECVLLYLNTVNLETCEYLLLYYIQQDSLLCDVFMDTIANTQNFSRFKQVFVNLTNFIVNHRRRFSLEVAGHILERVCIIPREKSLSEAVFQIVKNTDPAIFENSMIGLFEEQLSSFNVELYGQYLLIKKQAYVNRPVLENPFDILNREEPVINTSLVHTEREKRYTSPDTTHLDNMNKTADEPIITRTIDFNRARHFNVIQRSYSNSNSSMSNGSSEELPPKLVQHSKPNFQTWRGQSVFKKMRGMSPGPRQGAYPRPQLIKRQIHQQPNFRPGSTYLRRPGPEFF